ncbi:hypothetical protein [Streptosporangium sp. NPDC048865]|uniref:hypothetical protein n=1 Tax=Streptosporangium sp. NPDC048865 TaxID=3155766 RepID=UPI0034368FD2
MVRARARRDGSGSRTVTAAPASVGMAVVSRPGSPAPHTVADRPDSSPPDATTATEVAVAQPIAAATPAGRSSGTTASGVPGPDVQVGRVPAVQRGPGGHRHTHLLGSVAGLPSLL